MDHSTEFSQVYEAELEAIRIRRRVHSGVVRNSASGNGDEHSETSRDGSPTNSAAEKTGENGVDKDLIGLALSGGGVRSASCNLGVVQALDEQGIFSQIDYLSTVSGGGFLGGYISSLAIDSSNDHQAPPQSSESVSDGRRSTHASLSNEKARSSGKRITPLTPAPGKAQPYQVRRLIYSGDYLKLPLTFFNRYFIGLVLISIFWISGALALASGMAWLLRTLYETDVRYFLRALGFKDDVTSAFFPSFLLFIIWLIAWLLSYWRDRSAATGGAARVCLGFLLASVLLGIALVMGTGSISVGQFSEIIGVNISPQLMESIAEWLNVLILVPIALFLLPYFRPDRLLRSATSASAKWWERAVFKAAGVAMLIGVPLLMFCFFSRENISQWNDKRPGLLYYTDLSWPLFWDQLRASDGSTEPSKDLALDRYLWKQRRKMTPFANKESGDVEQNGSGETSPDLLKLALELYAWDPAGLEDLTEKELKQRKEISEQRREEVNSLVQKVHETSPDLLKLVIELYACDPAGLKNLAQQLAREEEPTLRESESADPPPFKRWKPLLSELESMSEFVAKHDGSRQPIALGQLLELSPIELDKLGRRFPKLDKLITEMQLRAVSPELLDVLERNFTFRRGDRFPSNYDLLRRIDEIQDESGASTKNISFLQRWLLLAGYGLSFLDGHHEPKETKFYAQLFEPNRDVHFLKLAAVANINQGVFFEHEKFFDKLKESSDAAAGVEQTTQSKIKDLTSLTATQKETTGGRKVDMRALERARETAKDVDDPQRLFNLSNQNRNLLIAYYGDNVVRPKDQSISVTVVTDQDQHTRWKFFGWTATTFLLAGFLVHLNVTSLQGFYRNQLARNWIADCGGFHRQIPLARLDTTSHGYPYHLISATANYIRRQEREQGSTDHFLFSNLYCGSPRTGYLPTTKYCGGSYDLASAVALSGAAVSPMQMQNMLLQLLLTVLNLRLGQWLPNPNHRPWWPNWLHRTLTLWPAPFLVMASLLRRTETRGFCLITDGGHYENLGIGPLLARRCRVIIASDVGHDPDYEFRDFVRLLKRQRIDHGVQICAVDHNDQLVHDYSKTLVPDDQTGYSKTHYFVAKIHYPDDPSNEHGRGAKTGWLIYLKPTFTNDMELELESQRRLTRQGKDKSSFPHDSTSDQFFTVEKFESYRQLGYVMADKMCVSEFRDTPTSVRDWAESKDQTRDDADASSVLDKPGAKPSPDEPTSGTDTGQPTATEQEGEQSVTAEETPRQSGIEATIAMLESDDENERKLAALSLGEAVEGGLPTGQRRQAVSALLEVFERKRDDMIRLMASQMLKMHPPSTERVRRLAVKIATDTSENVEIRLAALDLLAAVGLKSRDTKMRTAVEALQKDKKNRKLATAAGDVLRPQAAGQRQRKS